MENFENESVFGEPKDLDWWPGDKISLSLSRNFPSDNLGFMLLYTDSVPPVDAVMLEFLQKARQTSLQEGEPIFLCQTLERGERSRMDPIALYEEGGLEEYCRPPWRTGEELR